MRFALGTERLGAVIGWNAMTVALCSAAGPIAGAVILSLAPWPWLFLVKLPVGALALAAAVALPRVEAVRGPINLPGIALHTSTAALVGTAATMATDRPIVAASFAAAAIASASILGR